MYAHCRQPPCRNLFSGTIKCPRWHRGLFGPNTLGGSTALPFFTESRTFSFLVPSHRWLGLQQGGLSQEWQASIPGLRGRPSLRDSIRRLARTILSYSENWPYPGCEPRVRFAFQSQQSFTPAIATFAKNRGIQAAWSLNARLIASSGAGRTRFLSALDITTAPSYNKATEEFHE